MEPLGSGEEMERALMELGPLLGVSIKEELPEDPDGQSNAGGGGAESKAAGGGGEGAAGADSLASPGPAARVPRCVMCAAPLHQCEGTPKLMECLHSVCEPCLKLKVDEKINTNRDFLGAERITIQCPSCRLQCGTHNMIDQRFVLEKMALEQAGGAAVAGVGEEQQCNSCEETLPATSYCVDCAEFICDNCVQAHQRLKITKDHTIKSKEAGLRAGGAGGGASTAAPHAPDLYCSDHTQERLALFCETCDRLTCRDCQLHHHRDHKYQFSTEMAAQARANITALLAEVSYKRVLLGSAMKVIQDRQALIADKKKALVREITQTVVKLTNAINTRGKQLVLRLNEVCDSKQKTLSEKKEALEQLAAITDHCVHFVNDALDQGSDTAVLYSKRAVCAHLQRIKSRRADIPNPEIPVRISLALDKLPELIKVLSTIGGIVVDGKVDGGNTVSGAQGPYHPPPAAPPAAAPPPPPPQSAVVALQHVAMQQSYVQCRGGGGGGGGGSVSPVGSNGYGMGHLGAGGGGGGGGAGGVMSALQQHMRARPTPLRHPHVTSTTHPHHLHGVDMNLRGLLNQAGVQGSVARAIQQAAAAAGAGGARHHHLQHQHQQQQHYQQMMNAYASNAYSAAAAAAAVGGGGGAGSGRRSGGPRTPSPAPHHAAPAPLAPAAKWHIPQHSLQQHGGFDMNLMGMSGNPAADFKITLARQQTAPPAPPGAPAPPPAAAVTSTNPKTPSPCLSGAELDKVCAESVQDLMATIAKLDSNGVQVLPEHAPLPPPAAGPSPSPGPGHVHSSTDDQHGKVLAQGAGAGVEGGGAGGGADPNEDWCAVCMDGGELMCCDKCPKVFHQYCHIPTIDKLPHETETWQCLLCVNFAELPPETGAGMAGGGGVSPRTQKIIERITLELYCQYEISLPFREPVPADNVHYHSKIARPMCLDMIRVRLQPSAPDRYQHVTHFLADCRTLFNNAYTYNTPESQLHKDAKRLEEFFDAQLVKWLPEYAYWREAGGTPPQHKRARLD